MNQEYSGQEAQFQRNLPVTVEWEYPVIIEEKDPYAGTPFGGMLTDRLPMQIEEAEIVPVPERKKYPAAIPQSKPYVHRAPLAELDPIITTKDMVTIFRVLAPVGAVAGGGYAVYLLVTFLVTQWYFWGTVALIVIVLLLRSLSQDRPLDRRSPCRRDVITNIHVQGPVGNVITNVFVNHENCDE